MKNKTYYLGKMTYYKRDTDFEVSYFIEKDIKNFSFSNEYENNSELIAHKTFFDCYLVRMDELNVNQYVLFMKHLIDEKMYYLYIDAKTAVAILNGDFESPYIGDANQFVLKFGSIRNFAEINN